MIAALFALAALPSAAHEYVQVYNYPAADSCATWTRYRAARENQALEGWVLGFVTGRNAFGPGTGDLAPGVHAEGLTAWVDQYCAANPLESVSTASFKLVRELERRGRK